jgi:hypothetical protein
MARPQTHTENEVFLDEHGVIHTVYHGEQTVKALLHTIDRVRKIMDILIRDDKPVRLLADIRDMGQYEQPARIIEMHARTVLPFWKMAFVTSDKHPEGEDVSRKLTLMSGRKNEIRYFWREDDAIGWLSFMR